jgi:hypothetical protein
MSLDPKALSAIRAAHSRERADYLDHRGAQKRHLSQMATDRRQREVEEARANGGRSGTRLKSAEEDVRDRVAEHAKFDAETKSGLAAMNKKHAKELDDARAGKFVPARHGADDSGLEMNSRERSEYRNILAKYENRHNSQHNADEDKASRLSRYRSSAMTAKLEESRLAKHDEINKRREQELSWFRHKVESKHRVA